MSVDDRQRAELDPEIAELLAAREISLPPLSECTPSEARSRHREFMLAGEGTAPSMESVADVELGTEAGAPSLKLRYYVPADVAPLPGLVYLHGGGWVLGDLDTNDATCRHLAAATRTVVVSVAYRLAPEFPFPAAIEDCRSAIAWLSSEGPSLGARGGSVALVGSSAGANIAAGTAVGCRDAGDDSISAQLLLYPPLNPLLSEPSVAENGSGYYLTLDEMEQFVAAYLPDEGTRQHPLAAPAHADVRGLPPTVITTAGFDLLRDQGISYAERLRDAGVLVRHLHYPSLVHGYFGLAGRVRAAARARDEVLMAFGEVLERV